MIGRREPITEVRPGNWEVRWRTPDGQSRQRRGFPTRRAAKAFYVEMLHTARTGEYVDPRRITFGQYAEQWRTNAIHRPSTAAQVETNLRRHVLPHLGARPIGAIKPSEVQAWLKGRSLKLAPATVLLLYRYVSTIFRAAVRDDLIRKSPCVGIKPPKPEPARVEPLGDAAVAALVEAMPERYRALIVLGAGTGLRQGEAFGLTVDRVDFLRRTLTVDRQLVLMPGGPPTFGPPKTDASRRTIPVGETVITALAEHLRRFPVDADGPGCIFTDDDGRPIRRTTFSRAVWIPARTAAGLADTVTFHELRHYFASLLIRRGLSVKVVQDRLGHASADETLRTYTHLWPDDDDRTRQAVDEALAGFGGSSCYGKAVEE